IVRAQLVELFGGLDPGLDILLLVGAGSLVEPVAELLAGRRLLRSLRRSRSALGGGIVRTVCLRRRLGGRGGGQQQGHDQAEDWCENTHDPFSCWFEYSLEMGLSPAVIVPPRSRASWRTRKHEAHDE